MVRIREENEIGLDQASPVSKVLLAHASFPASEEELSLFWAKVRSLVCLVTFYPDMGFVKKFTQPDFEDENFTQ